VEKLDPWTPSPSLESFTGFSVNLGLSKDIEYNVAAQETLNCPDSFLLK